MLKIVIYLSLKDSFLYPENLLMSKKNQSKCTDYLTAKKYILTDDNQKSTKIILLFFKKWSFTILKTPVSGFMSVSDFFFFFGTVFFCLGFSFKFHYCYQELAQSIMFFFN